MSQQRQNADSAGIVLTSLVQTCTACPSQWEAADAKGNSYYIRYRWGFLSVVRNGVLGEPYDDGTVVYGEQIGDDLDGWLSAEAMLKATGMSVQSGSSNDA